MNDKKRISLDTNILVYALDKDAGEKHELAFEIIDKTIMHDTVLILQSLCEFFAAVTRKKKMPQTEAEAQVNDWMELFPIVSAKRETLIRGIKAVHNHSLSFWDSMLWAVAREANVTLF